MDVDQCVTGISHWNRTRFLCCSVRKLLSETDAEQWRCAGDEGAVLVMKALLK